MSWLHLRVVDPPSSSATLLFNERLMYRGAEVFINSAAMTCVVIRQDGALQIGLENGVVIAELIMEYGSLPTTFLKIRGS